MVRLILTLCFILALSLDASMQLSKEAGKEWGKKGASTAFDQSKKVDANHFLTADSKNQTFDAKKAAWSLENRIPPTSDTLEFLTSREVQENQRRKFFHEDELFIKSSEQIFSHQEMKPFSDREEETGYTLYTCKQAGDPFLISTERTLNVQVDHKPAELAKVCLGHQTEVLVEKKGDFKKSTKQLRHKYKCDSTIKPESVQITCLYSHPTSHHYLAQIKYHHKENADGCDKCKTQKIKGDTYQENGDEWIYDNQDLWNLSNSPDTTVIEHVCIDAEPNKMINGKLVNRQCWKEKISLLYQFPSTNDCNFLKQKNCKQIKQECLQYSDSKCTQWQLTFECGEKIILKSMPVDLELDSSEETNEYTLNQSFSEVAAKLAIFDQAKKEMEKSNVIDVTKLEIFQGKRLSCSKNVADHLMYDCCFSYSGLAKQAGLSKCSADEVGLAEMREKGLCYYVGSYEEKFLDLWKSRHEHVYCCFSSKLARIVQEEGRSQLGIDWGSPNEPNCRGFTTNELSTLNFSDMDLSEICEDFVKKLPLDMPERLQAFQNRLQQDIDRTEIKK